MAISDAITELMADAANVFQPGNQSFRRSLDASVMAS